MEKQNKLNYLVYTSILLLLIFSLHNLDSNIFSFEFLNIAVVLITAVIIFWYSSETKKLREINFKSFDSDINFRKIKETINLIKNFQNNVSLDLRYVLHDDFKDDNFENMSKILEGKKISIAEEENLIRFNNVTSFFELSGLMLKNDLIDLDIYYNYFSLQFKMFYSNELVLDLLSSSIKTHSDAWEYLFYLRDKFEEKN